MTDIADLLKRWPHLPDQAVVNSKLVAAVTGLSVRKSAERIAPVLKVDGATQLALPLEGANENQSGDVR